MQNVIRLGNIYNPNLGTSYAGNVWDKEGVCPTLTTMQGGGGGERTNDYYRKQ